MNLRWMSLLAVSLCIPGLLPTAPAAAAFTIRVPYEGAAPFAFSSPEAECGGEVPRSLGVVCVELPAFTRDLAFSVSDATHLAVGGSYYLYDAAGELTAYGTHCNGATLDARGAALAVVRVEALNGPLACAAMGVKGTTTPTKGVVTFSLR